jgi:hypothetical protein
MGDDYVPLLDQMPDIRDFMMEMQSKEAEKLKVLEAKQELTQKKKSRYAVGEAAVTRVKIAEKF